ncbi:MAG: hypothetical protein ACYDEX_19470 [Mobilitalea sp.]
MINIEFNDDFLIVVFDGEDYKLWYNELFDTEKTGNMYTSLINKIVDTYHKICKQEYPQVDDFRFVNCGHYKDRTLIMLEYKIKGYK